MQRRLTFVIPACLLVVPAFFGLDNSAAKGSFDGAAELPRVHVQSSMASTPAPGRVLEVHEGDDLQKAIDNAKCGDTLKLQAGATFLGTFRLPAKACDDSHWIIMRSDAPDDSLPAEGTRATPCYAGVASLPGRPEFHCASLKNVMAKIEFDGGAESGPILFLSGANHYRLIGLEITRGKPQLHMRNLIEPKDPDSTASHLVFDRLWLHGTAQDETKGGIHLSGTTYVAIVDSYFSDFHCIARSGSCTDAQAVNGGGGDQPGGPYKIENNFLEASGQSIMFGGAPGSTTPADIEIRRNHLFKPMIWRTGEAGFAGSYNGDPFIVKTQFELKNAQRLLFEGNVLDNCWGGFTQTGFSIVLTPANQSGKCPECRVTDITIRYNLIRHVASVFDIGNVTGKQQAPSSGGERYSIHDLLVEDIDGGKLGGFGSFAMIISVAPPLKSVHFDHVTAFPQRAILSVLNKDAKLADFSITNSIFSAGNRQMMGAGGGPTNCAQGRDDPAGVLKNCFADAVFRGNLIIGGGGSWPHENTVVKNVKDVGFRDFSGADFRVAGREGTDGKPIGADIDAIEKAVAGVM